MSRKNEKHGMSNTRLYKIWRVMRQRCNNPNDQAFKNYGAKGIKVCRSWNNSFKSFMEWAYDNGYREHLTIDRIDPNKGYTPDNCRWITRAENARRAQLGRRKTSLFIEFNGDEKHLEEWAQELGLNPITLYKRLYEYNWSVEEALTLKPNEKPSSKLITYKGVTKPLVEWSQETNIKPETLYQRIYRLGWSIEKALTTKTRTRTKKGGYNTKPLSVTYKGKTQSIRAWSEELKIPYTTLYNRLVNLKWDVEKAFTEKGDYYKKGILYKNKKKTLKEWSEELNIPYTVLYQRIYTLGWSVEKAFTTPIREKKRSI